MQKSSQTLTWGRWLVLAISLVLIAGNGASVARATDAIPTPTPVTVTGITNAVSVVAANNNTCALLADGHIKCWGSNANGQFGNGTTTPSGSPVTVPGISNAVSVSLFDSEICAVLATGAVDCWGTGYLGNYLGEGTASATNSLVPVQVSTLTNATSISLGQSHICALLADTTLSCWAGWGGNGTYTNSVTPLAVNGVFGVTQVMARSINHDCVLLTSGSVDCWGRNYDGQLGTGDGYDRLTPNPVPGITGATAVATGYDFSLALLGSGAIMGWGENDDYELGDGGSQTNRFSPVQVSGITNAVAIAGGHDHSCAALADGTVKCWGFNSQGDVGDGAPDISFARTPVPVSGISNAIAVSAGYDHSCALLASGTIKCWGDNNYGQLGNAAPPDSTPPVTSDDAPSGWQQQAVTVHLTATDDSSGVAATYYSIGGAPYKTGTSFTITAPADHSNDGTHAISYYSVDNAGNTEVVHATSVRIDTDAPLISASKTPSPNANGWNNSPVTVNFTCSDPLSGIASCPTPVSLDEGANQSATGTATDNAGNSSSASLSGINVDETAPLLSGAPTTNPNANGWYAENVTIHWTCSDALSGIAGSCPADDTLTGEGSSLSATESVGDQAGNTTTAASSPVKIDQTPPLTAVSAPGGWSSSGVAVTLNATDNLSGVAATYYALDGGAPQIGTTVSIAADGIHLIRFWSVDEAGNIEAARTVTVKVDQQAPTISHTLSPIPNAAGWNSTTVTVTFICSAGVSGVASCTSPQSVSTEGALQPVKGTATNNAGLSATDTALISIDETAPQISASTDRSPNATGWFKAPVIVTFTCSDALSGIALCPSAVTLGEGANQSATGIAHDAAGNTQATAVSNINIDETPPSVTYSGNAGTYNIDQTVSIRCQATDALSGIATSTCVDISGPAWSFGLGTTSRSTSATDKAGNTATASTTFTVAVTASSLDSLISQLFGGDTTGAAGLISKVDSISSAANANAKNGAIGAFDNQVDAKLGNPLTAAQVALLKQLAAAL